MRVLTAVENDDLDNRIFAIVNQRSGNSSSKRNYTIRVSEWWGSYPDTSDARNAFIEANEGCFEASIMDGLADELLQATVLTYLYPFESDWLVRETQKDLTDVPLSTIRMLYPDVLRFGPNFETILSYANWLEERFMHDRSLQNLVYLRLNAPGTTPVWQSANYEHSTTKYRSSLNYEELARLNRIRIQQHDLRAEIVDGSSAKLTKSEKNEMHRYMQPALASLVGVGIYSEGSEAEKARLTFEDFFLTLKETYP